MLYPVVGIPLEYTCHWVSVVVFTCGVIRLDVVLPRGIWVQCTLSILIQSDGILGLLLRMVELDSTGG